MNTFINHSQLITTNNYNIIADFHTKGLFTHIRDVSVPRQFSFSDIRDVSVTAIHTYQYRFSSSKSVIFEMTKFTDIELAVIAGDVWMRPSSSKKRYESSLTLIKFNGTGRTRYWHVTDVCK
jgi:hypothetical protein